MTPAVVDLDEPIPDWKEQITIRGLVVSAFLGALFSIITHKLNLTVGIIPSLNVAAGLLGFFSVKTWTGFLTKLGFSSKPFTCQENTVIQTCVVACYGLAFSGGFGSYLLSMDEKTYKLIGEDYCGKRRDNIQKWFISTWSWRRKWWYSTGCSGYYSWLLKLIRKLRQSLFSKGSRAEID